MAVIDPADKARFGESSVGLLLRNAEAKAKESGVALEVGETVLVVGGLRLEYVGGVVRTPVGDVEASPEEWELVRLNVLAHFVNNGAPPGEWELRQLLFAATGREP